MKATEPSPAAVEWLESPKNPTWWTRGRRPQSVHGGPMISMKSDDNPECGEWEEDFCSCIPVMPGQIYSLDWTEVEEAAWMAVGWLPAHGGDWSRQTWGAARRRFREVWAERNRRYVDWRIDRDEAQREAQRVHALGGHKGRDGGAGHG